MANDVEASESLVSGGQQVQKEGCCAGCAKALVVGCSLLALAAVAGAVVLYRRVYTAGSSLGVVNATVVAINNESPVFPGRQGHVNTALCFSGGGSRAFSNAFGIARGLHHLSLLDQFDALSCGSGGCWFSSRLMFGKGNTSELLGASVLPGQLSLEGLKQQPAPLGRAVTGNFDVQILKELIGLEDMDDAWVDTIGDMILQDLGLNNKKFLAGSDEQLRLILKRSPALQSKDFLLPRKDRPATFVMGGTILAPLGYKVDNRSAIPVQMSPDFVGSPFYAYGEGNVTYQPEGQGESLTQRVGGGLIESFAFGGKAPVGELPGFVQVPLGSSPFSLKHMVSISSMNEANSFQQTAGARLVVPQDYVWPIVTGAASHSIPAIQHKLGDAGITDNSAVLQMLQRGAKRVVSVLSTEEVVNFDVDFCNISASFDFGSRSDISWALRAMFGVLEKGETTALESPNQVFDTTEFQPLMCDIQNLWKDGKPWVVHRKLEVLKNAKWQIRRSLVDIVFFYLQKSKDFELALPDDTQAELAKGPHGAFAHFPNYLTMSQNADRVAGYTNEQVNLLAGFAEYTVVKSKSLLKGFLH